jgi:cell division protein FtsI (penicillin-binding protein 3)
MRALIIGVLVILASGLVWIQVVNGPVWANEARLSRTQKEVQVAKRGDILDVSGNVLATSVDKYIIAVDQKLIQSWHPVHCSDSNDHNCHQIDGHDVTQSGALGVAQMLSPLLGQNQQELAYKLNGDSRYKVIAKDVDPSVERQIAALNLGGMIAYQKLQARVYPNGNIAGPEIGSASSNPDGIKAQAGIELMMDEDLSGKPGEYIYEAGSGGEKIPATKSVKNQAVDGHNIKTTLDLDAQWRLQSVIDNAKNTNTADWAFGVIEKVKTGEIVAIAESNAEAAGSKEVALHGSRVFGTAFEPGSTVKVLTTASLIENNLVTPETGFTVPDHYTTSNNQVIKDAHDHSTARLTLTGIIGQSYNTGTVMASENLGIQQRYNFLHDFGFGQLTGVGFPGENQGLLNNWENWDGRTMHTVLFGQGLSVSPLQVVNSYATIANHGKNPVPTIISSIQDGDGNWKPYPKPEGKQVIRDETALRTLGVLEASVTSGMCSSAKMPDYRVGGKTGTAEVIGANGLSDTVQSFIGVLPLDNPQFAVGVFYKNPHVEYSTTATIPSFKEIALFLAQKYAISPSTPASYIPPANW